ncbi:MAG: discoidin domain-containing protein [Pseudomonadota bacterium]
MFTFVCLAAGTVGSPSASAAGVASLPASNRLKINLGASEWRYNLTDDRVDFIQPTFDDSAWKTTGIPHSPNESNMFTNWVSGGGAGFMLGRVWYRKHFKMDQKHLGRKVVVEFEGSHTGVQVYINGHFLPGSSALNPKATHVIGFLPFVVDLTPYLNFDGKDNVIAVKTASGGDFYGNPDFSGGYRFGQGDTGLFRPVSMYITDPVHIPQNVYATLKTWGTYVGVRSANRDSAAIHVETNILNESAAAKNVTLTTQILDKDGNIVARSEMTKTLPPNAGPGLQMNKYEQELTVDKPTLWFPNNSREGGPYMYRVFHIVSIDGAIIDAVESPLGIRIITWNNDYPLINGVPHSLWGGSGRYDYPALGTAVPEEQQWRDLQLLAQGGGSLYRPGHSSSSAAFVAAADALGIMLMQPSGDGEDGFSNNCYTVDCGTFERNKQNLKLELHREMVVRDRNNPSILAWELNNGAMYPGLANGLNEISRTMELVPALNDLPEVKPRPTTNRDAKNPANGDFLSCTRESCEINLKVTNPTVPTWNAESWGGGSVREAYDHELKFISSFLKDWSEGVAVKAFGLAQWYLADTPGETGEQADGTDPNLIRGLADSMLDQNRFPKLMYYAYQAGWTPYEVKPVVALAHHWNRSGTVRVNAFSNCPAVRLKVNGNQVGEIVVPNPIDSRVNDTTQNTTQLPFQAHWDNITWVAGTVTAECLDNTDRFAQTVVFNGKPVIDERKTAGPADHLELIAEPGLIKPDGEQFQVTANGTDAAFITARVVDAKGVLVPTARQNITFSVSELGNYRGGTQQRVTSPEELAQIGFLSAGELADYRNPNGPNHAELEKKIASYHSPDSPELQIEGGLQRIAVRSRFQPGTVTVKATAPGLAGAQTTFQVVAVPQAPTQDGAAPQVVSQPVSQSISAGEPARFTVTASGAGPLSFQWMKNGANIGGANGNSYVTPVTTLGDNNSTYSVAVSNGVGKVVSGNATLQVATASPAAIVTAPAAVSIPVGQVAKFSVKAAGSPTLKYKWLRNGVEIAGATGDSYTTAPATAADNGVSFSVTVSNAASSINSAPATLTVFAAARPAFTAQPANVVAQLGQSVTLSATVTGSAPMQFEWRNNGVSVAKSVGNIEGSNSVSLKIDTVKATDLGDYTLEVRNAATGNESVNSAAVSVTQAPPGDNLALRKKADATSYQDPQGMPASALTDGDIKTRWSSVDKVDNASVVIDLAAPTTFNRMILRWEAAYASQFKVEVSDNRDDAGSWKQVYLQQQGAGKNEDFAFPIVTARYVRVTGIKRASDYGYSLFEVEVYNVPACGPGERYNVLNADNVVDNTSNLTWTRRSYTYTEAGAQFTQPLAKAYCEAKGMRLPTRSEATGISKFNTASCAFPVQWNTWTSEAVDATYTYTVSSDGTLGQSLSTNAPGSALCVSGTTQAQAPAITAQPGNQSVAVGKSARFTIGATGTGLTYTWYRNDVQQASGAAAAYDTPPVVAGDNGAKYYVKVRNDSGEVTSQSATLTVTATDPVVGAPVIGTQPMGQTVGVGKTAQFTVGATGSGNLTYQWYRNNQAIDGAVGASYTTAALALANNGDSYTVTVSAGDAKVTSQPAVVTVQETTGSSDTVNLAMGKSGTASGVENEIFGKADFAFDGDAASRWASEANNDAAWITVNLGAVVAVSKVELNWEAASGKQYRIEVSSDGKVFTPVFTQANGQGGVESLSFPAVTAQYVRMQGVQRSTPYGYSLFEFKVFGPKQVVTNPPVVSGNLALNKKGSASGVENEIFGKADNAFDADMGSRWASEANNDAAWITVDLGTLQTVAKVQLTWEAASAKQYRIEVSQDGKTFKPVYTRINGVGGVETLSFAAETARYVRMQGVLRNTAYGYSLFDFQVFSTK